METVPGDKLNFDLDQDTLLEYVEKIENKQGFDKDAIINIYQRLNNIVGNYYSLISQIKNSNSNKKIISTIWEAFLYLLEKENTKDFNEGITAIEKSRVRKV